MHTINIDTISPVAVAAARADDWARIDGLTVNDWLTGYWREQLEAACPDRHDYDDANLVLLRLADALAVEDVTEAADFVIDYRELTDRPTNDATLTRMMLDALLDWSKWCGDPRIDDARAQSWLRSLLT